MLRAQLAFDRLDKDHRLLQRQEQLCRSFTRGLIGLLYAKFLQLDYNSSFTMTDIYGNSRTVDVFCETQRKRLHTLRLSSCAGDSGIPILFRETDYPDRYMFPGSVIGIVLGTGTNAVTPTDTKLQTQIAHGRSANQLEYGGCELINLTFSNPNGSFQMRRYFTNLSGGSITVNECGIYSTGSHSFSPQPTGSWVFCIARDLVSPAVTVNDTEILRVIYTIQITV